MTLGSEETLRTLGPTVALVLSGILAACDSPAAPLTASPQNPRLERSGNAPVHQVAGGGELDAAALFPGADKETYGLSATVMPQAWARGAVVQLAARQYHGPVINVRRPLPPSPPRRNSDPL
jgi:hypothetical protein